MGQPDIRHKTIGHIKRAQNRFHTINRRCDNNKSYKNVKFLIDKDEFISWFMVNDFKNCSVDRKDPKGHYEMSNIRMIPKDINSQRLERLSADGKQICRVCKERKLIRLFVTDRRVVSTGKSTLCKECSKLIRKKNA